MARPVKHNLDYFPLDVDFFENHKLILIEEDCGVKGGYLALRLMAMVYEKSGYFLEWKDKSEFSCAKRVGNGYTGALVNEILKSCLRHGLFNKQVFDKHRVLTSAGIQETWLRVMRDLRRKVEIDSKFLLVNEGKTGVSSEETHITPEETAPSKAESTQKDIRVNDIKVNGSKSYSKSEEPKNGNVVPAKPSPPKKVDKEKVKETEPFWDLMVKTWFDFNFDKFADKPSFGDADPRYLKKILEKLKKRAAAKNVEWNEISGPQRLKTFLEGAYSDPWLSKHYLLKNLNEQFDAIILKQKEASAKSKKETDQKKQSGPRTMADEVSYLFDRFCDGELNPALILDDHYDHLVARSEISVGLININSEVPTLEQKRIIIHQYFDHKKTKLTNAS